MNKIYKVIWSKVKNQYVVVSELAHSNGKQSRTARKSLRSRIAALVVCGAIAALGVYGALPTQQAFAAEGDETVSTAPLPGALANIEDYVAYKAESNANPNDPPDGYYLYTDPDNASIKYWVRDGFTIDLGQIKTQDGTGTSYGITNVYAPGDKGVFNEVLTNSTVVEEGMQAHRNDGTEIEGQKVQTNIGQALNQVNLGNLVGSTNAVGPDAAKVPMDYSYYIQNSRGQWVNVGLKHNPTDFYNNFKTVDNGLDYDEHTGKYYYTNPNGEKKVVDFDNIYYIDVGEEKPVAGVFVNDQGYLYEGTVWGATGEILTTAQDGDGLKTYWSAVANADDIYLKDSNLTVGELNKAFDTLETNDERLYNNDIKEITVKPGQNGGGTLGLLRNGTDENGELVEGAITVEGVGGTGGDDTGIKFSQKDETGEDIQDSVFTINTGSRVEGTGSDPSETSASQGSLTGLTINGKYYTVPEVTVSEDDDTVNIKEGDITNIDLITTSGEKHIATSGDTDPDNKNKPYTGVYTADADGTVELTEVDGTGKATENTLQIKDVASKTALDKLDDLAVKYDDKNKDEITLGGLGEDGEPSKDPVAIHNVADGVGLNDAVNVSQLKQATAAATTTVSEGKNIDITPTVAEDGHTDYKVSLQDNISLGDGKITLNGAPAEGDDLLNVDNAFVVGQDGTTTITADDAGTMGADTKVTVGTDGVKFEGLENGTTTIDGQTIQAGGVFINDGGNGQITRLTNTTLDDPTFATVGRAATEEQLQLAKDAATTTVSEGKNIDVTSTVAEDGHTDYKVSLQDEVKLGDYDNGTGIYLGGASGTISATGSISVGEDQGLIIDGQKKEIQGLSNTTWNEKIANDAAVEGSTAASTAATQGQLQEVSKVANAGWTASDGTNSISVKPNETLNFVGDENLTVSADGTDKELKVALKDDITLKGDSSSIELTGTKGTIQVNQETAEGTNFTNINGNVVSIGYTNSEGIENAIVIDGGKGTITGLSNTTWDDELAKQVANSEELQGTAATQGQLQQAVSAVATEAAKQHTT